MHGNDADSTASDSLAGVGVEGFLSNSAPITTMAPNPTDSILVSGQGSYCPFTVFRYPRAAYDADSLV